jgi:outer membrane protein insertion porin family
VLPRGLILLVAVTAAAPLAAQQEQRVVRGLSFQGNHAIDDYTLRTAIATTWSSTFARWWLLRWTQLGAKRYLNEVEFRRDVLRLLLLYRRSGYVNVVIDTTVRRTARDAFITFRVHEGEPVRLKRLDIVGADSIFDVPKLKKDLDLQVGGPFSRFSLQASADTIVGRLNNRGYPYAQVLRNFDEDDAALSAAATLEVVPGPRMRIGEVTILGLDRVDTGTVRGLLRVKPYDLFRRDLLYKSQRDLYGLGVFRSVSVQLADSVPPTVSGDTLVGIVVHVGEGPGHRVLTGVGYGTIDCFRLQEGWTAYNYFGGARALDLTGTVSKIGVGNPLDAGLRTTLCRSLQDDPTSDTLNYNVGLTLRQPTFVSPRHSARLSVFAERRSEFKLYTRRDISVNPAVTLNARRNLPVTVGYTFSVGRTTADAAVFCSVFRVCSEADRTLLASTHRFAAVTASAVHDRVNSVLDPTNGSLITLALMHASRRVGSDTLYEFNRGELSVSQYYRLGRRGVFAWRARAGMIVPAGSISLAGQSVRFVPPEQRFYGGGPNSVRGYARNELGPRVYVTNNITVAGVDSTFLNVRAAPTGGNASFVLNTEVRFATPLFPDRMRAAMFLDVGQVWERGDQPSGVRGVRVTPGVGLRFATLLGPVRIDAAYNGYAAEAGPLYFQDDTDHSLTLIRDSYQPVQEQSFWRRIVVQFAVGQAF